MNHLRHSNTYRSIQFQVFFVLFCLFLINYPSCYVSKAFSAIPMLHTSEGNATWKKWCLLFLYYIFRNFIILGRCNFHRWTYLMQLYTWSLTFITGIKLKKITVHTSSSTKRVKISHELLPRINFQLLPTKARKIAILIVTNWGVSWGTSLYGSLRIQNKKLIFQLSKR